MPSARVRKSEVVNRLNKLADRLAGANMSAGHPNGVSPVNLYHVPFAIQMGENDSAYNRNL